MAPFTISCFSTEQAARQGLEKCQQELVSAVSEANKAAAQIGIELYDAVIKALEH